MTKNNGNDVQVLNEKEGLLSHLEDFEMDLSKAIEQLEMESLKDNPEYLGSLSTVEYDDLLEYAAVTYGTYSTLD